MVTVKMKQSPTFIQYGVTQLEARVIFGAYYQVSDEALNSSKIDYKEEIARRLQKELNYEIFNDIKFSLLSKLTALQEEYEISFCHAGFIGAFSDIRESILETFKESEVKVE